MPKLLILAACGDVLLDDENNPTLISVFIALEAMNIKGEVIDPRSLAPRKWMIFTMWRAESEDLGKTFTQKIEVETPTGDQFGSASEDFKMDKLAHTLKTRIHGFPVGIQGDVLVKVWLEVAGKRVSIIRKLPINVKHVKERPEKQ